MGCLNTTGVLDCFYGSEVLFVLFFFFMFFFFFLFLKVLMNIVYLYSEIFVNMLNLLIRCVIHSQGEGAGEKK